MKPSPSAPAGAPTGAGLLWMVTLACLLWALVSWLANGNLDGYHDMLENYAWSQPLQLGTHKHPPFFAWVVGLWFMVFPQNDAFYRLLSYANVGVGLWGVYVLGRRLGLARLAPLGALLLLWCFRIRRWPASSTPTASCCPCGPGRRPCCWPAGRKRVCGA